MGETTKTLLREIKGDLSGEQAEAGALTLADRLLDAALFVADEQTLSDALWLVREGALRAALILLEGPTE